MHAIEPEELMAYLDGELAPERAAEAARHLPDCPECQAVAADLQSVSRKLLEWQVEEPGPTVERIVNAARPPQRVRPDWGRSVPWLMGLAAAGVLLSLVAPPRFSDRQKAEQAVKRLTEEAQQAGDYGARPSGESAAPRAKSALRQFNSPAAPATVRGVVGGTIPAAAPAPTADTLIVRTAQITLIATDFANARGSLEDILKRHGGHIGNLTIAAPNDSGQTLQATLRVPAAQLDSAMSEIRHLGRVENEQQSGEEVTQQVVDLEARLTNARNTERRLADILNRYAGNITDVLAVETEVDRVRGEIERMEAERKDLGDRVSFATLEVRISEEYKAHLAVTAPSTFSRLRNAAVDGYRNVADSLTGVAMFLLSSGPILVLWMAILFLPARYAWKRLRRLIPRKRTEDSDAGTRPAR
jgi:anti-sigma factor RsiW